MTFDFRRGLSAALILGASATAAQADLSAQDVWQDWQSYLGATGYDLSATETMSGDTLTVSDTTLVIAMPEDEGNVTMTLGELTFTEMDDGTVTIGLPASMPITFSGTDSDGAAFEAVLNYTNTGFQMVASGDPQALSYAYSAATIGIALDQVTVDGEVLPPENAAFDMALTNLSGTTQTEGTGVRTYTQAARADGLTYTLMFIDPENGGNLNFEGGAEGFAVNSVSSLPEDLDMENMAAAIEAGFSADGEMTFGTGSSNLSFEDGAETFAYQSTSDGGSVGFTFGEAGLGYEIEQNNVAWNMAGSELPIPVALNMAKVVFDFLVPVMESEESQPFALTINLDDFTMSDLIWGIFDPTGQLPRDPATLLIALEGQARMLANVLDPEVAAGMEQGPPPAELDALTITGLELSLAGASLTGSGDFTFDNSDTETFNGMPRPTGAVDLQLVGGNGLIDKLVAMGLLPEEEAMGARMMMGLFAVPGDGEDTLNSRLEINEEGHILANGQRIQ